MSKRLSTLAKNFVERLPRLGGWLCFVCLLFGERFLAVFWRLLACYCALFLIFAIWILMVELYEKCAPSIFSECIVNPIRFSDVSAQRS